jgi:hypothetical protein
MLGAVTARVVAAVCPSYDRTSWEARRATVTSKLSAVRLNEIRLEMTGLFEKHQMYSVRSHHKFLARAFEKQKN